MSRLGYVLAIGLALVLVLAGCVPYRIAPDRLTGYAGVTFCVRAHQAIAFVSLDVLDTDDLLTVPPHERMHLAQFARFRSCRAARAYYGTTTGRLAMEAEAYAAGYCAGVRQGLAAAPLRADMLERLSRAMRRDVPAVLATAAFDSYAGRCA